MIVKHILSADAGELSPWLDARTDMAKYASGLRLLENFVVTPQGGVTKRPGMEYRGALTSGATTGKLIEFQLSTGEAAILALGGGEIRFWLQDGTMVLSSGSPYTVAIPWTDDELEKVRFKQINDVMYFVHGSHSMRRLLHYSNTNWVLEEVPHGLNHPLLKENLLEDWKITTVFPVNASATAWATANTYPAGKRVTDGGKTWVNQSAHISSLGYRPGAGTAVYTFIDPETYKILTRPLWVEAFVDRATVIGQSIGLTSNVDTWASSHVGSVWQISKRRESASYEVTLQAVTGNNNTASTVLVVQGGWTFQTFGTWKGTFIIQRSSDNGSTWEEIRRFTSAVGEERNASTEGSEDSRVLMRLYYIHVAAGSSSPYAILSASDAFVRGLVRITAFTNSKSVTAECISPVELGATSYWSEGAWSAYQGYPSVIETHQARLVVAATALRPHSVWGSAIDDFPNFKIGTDDSEAYWHTVPVGERDPILWLVSERLLLLGTGSGEFVMAGETDEKPIVPEFGTCRRQTSFGSNDGGVSAIFSDTVALFIQRGGIRVREFSFKFEADRYEAANLNILSDHLFSEDAISAAAIQRMPFQIVWFVAGGKVFGLTYERNQNVVAWHRHSTDGTVISIASIRTASIEDQVWFLVDRGGDLQVERFHPGGFMAPADDGWWVDSAIELADPFDMAAVPMLSGHEIYGFNNGRIYGPALLSGSLYPFVTGLDVTGLPPVDVEGVPVVMDGRWDPAGERNGKNWFRLAGTDGDGFSIQWTVDNLWVIYGNGNELFSNATDAAVPDFPLWTDILNGGTSLLSISPLNETPLDFDPFLVVADTFTAGADGTYKPDGTYGGKTRWSLPGSEWFIRYDLANVRWEHGRGSLIFWVETVGGSPVLRPDLAAGWQTIGTPPLGGTPTFTTVDAFFPPMVLGTRYNSTFFPMRPEIPTANGSSRSREIRIHGLVPSLYKSKSGKFGVAPGGELLPLSDGSRSELFTGEIEKSFPGSFNTDGNFCLVSDEPLPFAIRSVAIKFNVFGDAS